MVIFSFGPYKNDLGNLQGPHKKLILSGTFLMTEEMLILAELTEDQNGRTYWKPYTQEIDFLPGEIHIYGMGKLP